MRVIEISEKKREKMSEHVEDALYAMGKVMACLEELDGEMGERNSQNNRNQGMGNRDRFGNRINQREDYGNRSDWEDDDDEPMGERRRRSRRSGRFM